MEQREMCEIVGDLLPSYIDKITSVASNNLVEEHLESCIKCKETYNAMAVEVDKKEVPKKEVKILKKYKKILARILLVASIICVSFTLIVGATLWYFFTGGMPVKVDNPKRYEQQFEKFSGYSNLNIFPQSIPKEAEAVNYYYYYRDTIFDPTYQIYLECTYNEERYKAEEARLKAIKETYGNEEQKIAYNTKNFVYPAYVATFEFDYMYEYAILNEKENKIIYIFLQHIPLEKIVFEKQYLPKPYLPKEEKDLNSYSIYAFPNYSGWQTTY